MKLVMHESILRQTFSTLLLLFLLFVQIREGNNAELNSS